MPVKRSRVIKVSRRSTGIVKNLSADRKRKALKPGKRKSSTGKTYYETRRNMSDRNGLMSKIIRKKTKIKRKKT